MHNVTAASAEIHGEHLVLLDSTGKLAALFLLEIVESWSELPNGGLSARASTPRSSSRATASLPASEVPGKSCEFNRWMQHHLIEIICFRGGVHETRKTVWSFCSAECAAKISNVFSVLLWVNPLPLGTRADYWPKVFHRARNIA